MSTIPQQKLDTLVGRWNVIQAELNAGVNQAQRTKLTKEFSQLNPIVATIEAMRAAERNRPISRP
jgi:peptide chain release factor 1